jgi:hypothetical protein
VRVMVHVQRRKEGRGGSRGRPTCFRLGEVRTMKGGRGNVRRRLARCDCRRTSGIVGRTRVRGRLLASCGRSDGSDERKHREREGKRFALSFEFMFRRDFLLDELSVEGLIQDRPYARVRSGRV